MCHRSSSCARTEGKEERRGARQVLELAEEEVEVVLMMLTALFFRLKIRVSCVFPGKRSVKMNKKPTPIQAAVITWKTVAMWLQTHTAAVSDLRQVRQPCVPAAEGE